MASGCASMTSFAEGVDTEAVFGVRGVVQHNDRAGLHGQRAERVGQGSGGELAGGQQRHAVGDLGHGDGNDLVGAQAFGAQQSLRNVFDDGAL